MLAEQHTNFITAIQSAKTRGFISQEEARLYSHINKAANDAKHEIKEGLEANTSLLLTPPPILSNPSPLSGLK